ncbi:HdeD family acid-resistance protein [Bosea sp. NPDC003192]|uniref:HdeD family acid-resistance protein n=1 Tax=Bosea sp. NPDC003192 TaxID=3390551 RepID=UPI003D02D570
MTQIDKGHDVLPFPTLRAGWGWFVALGVAFIILGLVASSHLLLATIVTVYYLGGLMMLAGVLQVVQSFQLKQWGGFLLWLASGILYAAAGVMAFLNPALASSALTLLLALFTAASGIARTWLGAGAMSEPGWGWVVASGVLSTIVGLILLLGWPVNSSWVLGLVLAVDLVFQGCAMLAAGLRLRSAS